MLTLRVERAYNQHCANCHVDGITRHANGFPNIGNASIENAIQNGLVVCRHSGCCSTRHQGHHCYLRTTYPSQGQGAGSAAVTQMILATSRLMAKSWQHPLQPCPQMGTPNFESRFHICRLKTGSCHHQRHRWYAGFHLQSQSSTLYLLSGSGIRELVFIPNF